MAISRKILFLPILIFLFGAFPVQEKDADRTRELREKMVTEQIAARGVVDKNVLSAMRVVPRHLFVPEWEKRFAYQDRPLPIGYGQTMSQPYIVAYMTEMARVKPDSRVLEIGAGSGYQAAVLAQIVKHVYTVEVVPELAQWAETRLRYAGYDNVRVKHADGYYGWAEHAPYQGIAVAAGGPAVVPALCAQPATAAAPRTVASRLRRTAYL